ncbi:MAG TPA: dephospho-CoA kinase [Acidimicrobiia bacterium]|nr:dephospho-CoA kinase [Acidimicrobiia bacterium]
MAKEVPEGSAIRVILGGGIGAGKTSVGSLFATQGFTLIVADDVGREVLAPGSDATRQVEQRWPTVVSEGVVDRGALAGIVFSSRDDLVELEAITHPEIERRIESMLDDAGRQPCAIETPVPGLLGSVSATRIAIVADDHVRIARAVSRGGSIEDVRARMASQVDQDVWRAWSDVIVDNSGAWADTERAVSGVIEELMSHA